MTDDGEEGLTVDGADGWLTHDDDTARVTDGTIAVVLATGGGTDGAHYSQCCL